MIAGGLVSKSVVGIESRTQPARRAIAFEQHRVEPAPRYGPQAGKKVPRCMDDAPAFDGADAGSCASVAAVAALTDLDEDQRSIGLPHNQIDFAATAPGGAKVAHHQLQALAAQQRQRRILGLPAHRLRRGRRSFIEAAHVSLPSIEWLAAARQAAGSQHYPEGVLYMLATPIGNRADISLRALHVLDLVDAVACEDTRHTAALLQAYGLHKPLIAAHEHNEHEAAQAVLARLRQGERVAYVSDAGTPGVSDPGARLVAEVQAAGLRCAPLPGASSVTALLSVAGDFAGGGRWCFEGFLPSRGAERERALQALAASPQACVVLEAPHRIEALALAMAQRLGSRTVTVGRELTKQFEEVATLPAAQLPGWLAANPQRTRGEFALLVHTAPAPPADATAVDDGAMKVLDTLLAELPLKTAVKLAAQISGAPRNALYDAALARKPQG